MAARPEVPVSRDGLILPTPTFVATGAEAVASTPSPGASAAGSGVERLAAELQAVRLQAQRTQAGLAQLRQPASAASPIEALGTAGALGAVGVLALGLLALGWWLRRGPVRRGARPGMAVADARMRRPEGTAQRAAPMPAARTTAPAPVAAAPSGPAPVEPARPTPPVARPMVQDSAFRPSSLDVTFVEHDALDSSMMPATASRLGRLFDAAPALAVQAPPTDSVAPIHFEPPAPQSQPEPEPGPEPVDVLLEFPDPVADVAQVEVAPATDAGSTEPAREIDVSVSLIQELRGLGLWSEARELAKEVVSSAHAPLDADLATSLHQVQYGTPAAGERRKKERG